MITLIMLFEKDIYYGKKIHNVHKFRTKNRN